MEMSLTVTHQIIIFFFSINIFSCQRRSNTFFFLLYRYGQHSFLRHLFIILIQIAQFPNHVLCLMGKWNFIFYLFIFIFCFRSLLGSVSTLCTFNPIHSHSFWLWLKRGELKTTERTNERMIDWILGWRRQSIVRDWRVLNKFILESGARIHSISTPSNFG